MFTRDILLLAPSSSPAISNKIISTVTISVVLFILCQILRKIWKSDIDKMSLKKTNQWWSLNILVEQFSMLFTIMLLKWWNIFLACKFFLFLNNYSPLFSDTRFCRFNTIIWNHQKYQNTKIGSVCLVEDFSFVFTIHIFKMYTFCFLPSWSAWMKCIRYLQRQYLCFVIKCYVRE